MDSLTARSVAIQFEAMLVEQMIAPLESSFGDSGTVLGAPLARSIAERESGGFASMLSAMLERR